MFMASSISSNSKIYFVTSFDEYFALNIFYNSGFLLWSPCTERNTLMIEFEVTGKWSASWQERIDKSFNVITILKSWTGHGRPTWNWFQSCWKSFSFEALYSCVHFLPTKEAAENASFLLLPALVVCLPSKSVVRKTFKKFLKSKLKISTSCKKLNKIEELTPSSESPSLEPMLTRLPCWKIIISQKKILVQI